MTVTRNIISQRQTLEREGAATLLQLTTYNFIIYIL